MLPGYADSRISETQYQQRWLLASVGTHLLMLSWWLPFLVDASGGMGVLSSVFKGTTLAVSTVSAPSRQAGAFNLDGNYFWKGSASPNPSRKASITLCNVSS